MYSERKIAVHSNAVEVPLKSEEKQKTSGISQETSSMDQSDMQSIKIVLDEETAAPIINGWGQSTKGRAFTLFFKQPEQGQDRLKVSQVVHDEDDDMEDSFSAKNEEEDDLESNIVLVKVSDDGTFHYELDVTDMEVNSSSEEDNSKECNVTQHDEDECSAPGIDETSNIKNQSYDTDKITNDTNVAITAQNRPPVIILNTGNVSNIKNEPPILMPPSLVFMTLSDANVANEIEVNTSQEKVTSHNDQEEDIADVLQPKLENNQSEPALYVPQKQLAQVAPFQSNSKTSKRTQGKSKSPKSPASADAQDFFNEIRNSVIKLGPNNTIIPGDVYYTINWSSVREATRSLLTTLFPREILATHTLTGKPSPAFRDRKMPIKKQLDAGIISDIIAIVTKKCNVDARTVRAIITLKCADENKMLKMRIAKQMRQQENKENRAQN